MTCRASLPSILSAGLFAATLGLTGCDAGSAVAGEAAATQAAASSAAMTAASSTASGLTGGLLGNMGLPNLSGTSSSNLAGVLSYCVQNNLTSGSTASSLVSSATQSAGVTGSPAYTQGQQGILQAINNQTAAPQQFSLSTLAQPIRQRVCTVVQNQLQRLL